MRARRLAQGLNNDRLRVDAVRQHFSSIASGQQFVALDLKSDSFEAVHLPFVLGSLHLTLLTLVIAHYRVATGQTERIDYEDFIGKRALATPEAQRSTLAVMGHALSETRRILKPGGLMMIQPVGAAPARCPLEWFDCPIRWFRRQNSTSCWTAANVCFLATRSRHCPTRWDTFSRLTRSVVRTVIRDCCHLGEGR